MSAIHEISHTVDDREIDEWGHVNNLAYLHWLLRAAKEHSALPGWDAERYRRVGGAFVVRAHRIEYLRPALPAEVLRVRTWIATMKGVTSQRRYEIHRPADQQLLTRAATDWVFVDLASGKPRRIPVEISQAFTVVETC